MSKIEYLVEGIWISEETYLKMSETEYLYPEAMRELMSVNEIIDRYVESLTENQIIELNKYRNKF